MNLDRIESDAERAAAAAALEAADLLWPPQPRAVRCHPDARWYIVYGGLN